MTDKEFKRLSRSQLIEIIYQFQIKVEELTRENETLNAALEDKRIRITQAGNLAEAVFAVNNVMQSAQNAAQQYLDEIQARCSEMDEECQNIRKKANDEADAVIAQAKTEAAAIIVKAQAEAAAILNQKETELSSDSVPPNTEAEVSEEEKQEQTEEPALEETEQHSESDE